VTRVILVGQSQRAHAKALIDRAPKWAAVTIKEDARTVEQNRALWPRLHDIAAQVDWYGEKLTPEEWKDVFSAALSDHQRVVRGINGGMVFVGARTSQMSMREFSDLLELIEAFAAERGVVWSRKEEAA
jgi:hypothetical protein